jgi:predicted anti-sigma-YlaC factor YlaD
MKESGMNCNDYQRWINRIVDHEARATESTELFEHLGKCAECCGFLDALMKLNAELERIQTVAESEKDMSTEHRAFGDRRAVRCAAKHGTLRSRILTFALLIMVTLFIGTLLSVDVRLQRTPEPVPQEMAQPH